MPEVSVIIPNYNHADYLRQRIDSVLNQTYRDFEIIILDDCSADKSKEVIETYRGNERLTNIVYNSKNTGNTFEQWDKGIQLALGKYIWIAESDDWCEPIFLETIMNGIKAHENIVIGYCQSYCIEGDNRIKFQSNHPRLFEYIDGIKFIKEYLLPKISIFNAGMAVWRKDVYKKISKDFINYKLIGDQYFWIEISNHGNIFISGKPLNFFRAHEKNVSINSFSNGSIYKEQIVLSKHLLEKQVINKKDYIDNLKMQYLRFRFSEKDMPRENVLAIKKLFSSAVSSLFNLKIHFYRQYAKTKLKQVLSVANRASL